jgi:T5SS/PEP-CTERM-associated repeat protein
MHMPHPRSLATAVLAVSFFAPYPARSEITVDAAGFQFITSAAFDLNGDGVVNDGELANPPAINGTGDVSQSAATELGGARGSARQTTTVSAGDGVLSMSSTGDCESTAPLSSDDEGSFVPGASSAARYSLTFTVTERSRFVLSGSVAVSPPVAREGGGSNRAGVLSSLFDRDVDIEADDAFRDPQFDSAAVSGELEPGSYGVVGACDSAAPRLEDLLPVGTARWQLSLTVSEIELGDVFRWVGPVAGAFGDDGNWDPDGPATSGVPAFVPGERSDTALFRGGRARVDVAASALAAAASAGPRGPGAGCAGPIAQTIGRLVVDRVQELEIAGGALALDALSLDERSLVVGPQASLALQDGTLCARHATIGAAGRPSDLVVAGPGGVFETLGRLSIGAAGDGTLHVESGGIATSEEVRIGDGAGKGAALVSDATWRTGNVSVGSGGEGTLTISDFGLVESEDVFVDRVFEPGQGATAKATVRGAGSRWSVGDLFVGGRGLVEVTAGARIEADPVDGDVTVGLPTPGEATLLVNDQGELTMPRALDVGVFGAGRMVVAEAFEGNPRVEVGGKLQIGDFSTGSGRVLVVGDPGTTGFSLVSDSLDVGGAPGSRGELAVDFGGQLLTSTDAFVGTRGGEGRAAIAGALDAALTRWQISRSLTIGAPDGPTLGTLLIRDATVDVGTPTTAGSVLVQPGGAILGRGALAQLSVADGAITNHGLIVGPIVLDARYDADSTGQLFSAFAAAPAPQPLAARSPAGTIAALGAPRRRPPLPAQGPIVFTGEAALGGTLVLRFLNGFAPRAGDAFALVEAAGVTGDFDEVVVEGLAPGAAFEQTLEGGTVVLTATADTAPLPVVTLKAKARLKEKTKRAAVTFRRTGDVSQPLAVSLRFGGSARAGLDYFALPETIEFPAGKRAVKLPVRPLRDGITEPEETLEIEILPGAEYTTGVAPAVSIALRSAE